MGLNWVEAGRQVQTVNRQLQSKNLRTFSVKQKGGFEEADLNEIIWKAQSVLPLLLRSNRDSAVNIALSEKDLKILADSRLMVGALLSLVGSARHALPGGGALSLSTTGVDFTYRSILDGNHYRYGGCASLATSGRGIDGWWAKDKLLQRMLTRETGSDKDCERSTAYRIIKQHHGSIRRERVTGPRYDSNCLPSPGTPK